MHSSYIYNETSIAYIYACNKRNYSISLPTYSSLSLYQLTRFNIKNCIYKSITSKQNKKKRNQYLIREHIPCFGIIIDMVYYLFSMNFVVGIIIDPENAECSNIPLYNRGVLHMESEMEIIRPPRGSSQTYLFISN